MPIQRCERNEEQGWQRDNEGKCYLPSEEGSDEAAKQKAIDQAIAAGASPDEFSGQSDGVTEFATLVDVPILKAGTHNSHNKGEVTISEEELDNIIEGSNAIVPIVKESLETGIYRGNEELKLSKMPGFLNFLHGDFLPNTIKEATKNVSVSFKKGLHDGKTWMIQTMQNVPSDIAQAIKTRFPYCSVELIPFKDPNTGKQYDRVVRSTAFLNKLIHPTPPAVSGQPGNIAVEFAENDSALVLFSNSGVYNIQQQEDEIMQDNTKEMPDKDVTELQQQFSETTAELQAEKAKNDELQRQQTESEQKIAELQAGQAELQKQQAARDVIEFKKDLSRNPVKGADGVVYCPSPAFCDKVESLLNGTSTGAVIELAEGQQPARSVLMQFATEVIELASKDGGLLVAMGEIAPSQFTPPTDEQRPKNLKEMTIELQKQAKEKGEKLSERDAWVQAHQQMGTWEHYEEEEE